MKDGNHLILDLKNCEKIEKLSSKKFVENFIFELVKIAEMKAIIKPKVLYYEHEEKEESGVTGFVIIADSHVSIHTYPFKESLYLDLFSCKKFNSRKIVNLVQKTFEPKKLTKKLIKR
ncbi:S-adenosylmethionine decarboxylase [Patescibacteria group bacterium]|nr:S-adenosylmethionine decarboxylase [Patescibacteria group bacterium]MBU2579613.1 S-adenosylmethionine decarboxylase [Patescibacteria group bacterium]